jgi:hypothetical protein
MRAIHNPAAAMVLILLCAGTASAQSAAQAQADAMAIYLAEQQVRQAQAEATGAAMLAGQAQGKASAKQGSHDDRFKMVSDAVKNWKRPRGYAATAPASAGAIRDPFAPKETKAGDTAGLQSAVAGTGLVLDGDRGLVRVEDAAKACEGRLHAGDYPTTADGALLDSAERVTAFLKACGDRTQPVMVITPSGDPEIRK